MKKTNRALSSTLLSPHNTFITRVLDTAVYKGDLSTFPTSGKYVFLSLLPFELWLYHSLKIMFPNAWPLRLPVFFHCLLGASSIIFHHVLFFGSPFTWVPLPTYANLSLLWFLLCRSFPKFLPSTSFAPQYFSFRNFICTQDFSYALYGNHPNVYLHNRCLQNYKSVFAIAHQASPLHCLTTNLNQQNCKWLNSSSIPWTIFPRSLGTPRQSSNFIYFRSSVQNFSKAALMGKYTLISVEWDEVTPDDLYLRKTLHWR